MESRALPDLIKYLVEVITEPHLGRGLAKQQARTQPHFHEYGMPRQASCGPCRKRLRTPAHCSGRSRHLPAAGRGSQGVTPLLLDPFVVTRSEGPCSANIILKPFQSGWGRGGNRGRLGSDLATEMYMQVTLPILILLLR